MSVTTRIVAEDDGELRLDRWFRRHYPGLSHIQLQKLLRTGQVRVDGKRAEAGTRIAPGAHIRIPPLDEAALAARAAQLEATPKAPKPIPPAMVRALQARVLYRDHDVLVLNKPAGLAVQGGSGLGGQHLDAMLDALAFDGERPRLVHRLDRDTSGVLLLARTARAAAALGLALRGRSARKYYWGVTVGVPKPPAGRIDQALAKLPGMAGERMAPDPEGKRSVSLYATVEAAAERAAWVALWPVTGRTHQLRVHLAGLGTPLLGDGKYAGPEAFLPGAGLARQLHLHARRIEVAHPAGRGLIAVEAPLPPHMQETWAYFGFSARESEGDPFAGVDTRPVRRIRLSGKRGR